MSLATNLKHATQLVARNKISMVACGSNFAVNSGIGPAGGWRLLDSSLIRAPILPLLGQ